MNYVKKKFADAANRIISWFSTDDNVLCQNGQYLNENLDAINNKINDFDRITVSYDDSTENLTISSKSSKAQHDVNTEESI